MERQHKVILRCENLMIFIAGIVLFWQLDYSWLLFCYFIFLPDLSMLGYFVNNRVGAVMYNLAHNYVYPLILLSFYPLQPYVLFLSLIWIIHISFDRMMGYGLKSSIGFKKTHLSAN